MNTSLLPLGLCLLSAICVAASNMFVKRGSDVLSTRAVSSFTMMLVALPLTFFVPLPDKRLWAFLLLTMVAHWIYQFAVVRALHRGDLSLVFPVMRGLSPLLTAIIASFALNETPSLLGWAGLVTATLALFVFALPEDANIGHTPLKKAALVWAVLTAGTIALYSVVDAYGIRQAASPATFIVWMFMLDWIGMAVVLPIVRRGRVWQGLRPQLRGGFRAAMFGMVSYAAAMWAFTMTEAATVTAVRETSVVFGALFGAVFLKEAFGTRRIIAAIILASGLLLLEVGL